MQLFPGRNSYLLVLLVVAVDAVWIGLSNLVFPLGQLLLPAASVAVLAVLVLVIGRRRHSDLGTEKVFAQIGCLLQGIAFLQIAWIAIRVFNHVSMSSAFPYADRLLAGWDSYLPLSWIGYFRFVADNPLLLTVMDYSYTSLTLVSLVGFFVLVVRGEARRTAFFLETFLVAAVVCTAAGMFFPAKAAVATYFGDVSSMPNFSGVPGVYHLEYLEQLRSGLPVSLDINDMPGLVTFPSFHTAAGVLLAVSFWRTALFPAVLGYVTLMIASTPVFGGHYFIDLLAGAAVAAAIAAIFARLPSYKGMFRRTHPAPAQPRSKPADIPAAG